jgi:CBS domain-containing protein
MMSAPVVHVAPHATVAQALRAMIDHDIGAIVVVEGETAVGIFTERDLSRRILDDPDLLSREVSEVMSTPVTTVGSDDHAALVAKVMSERKVRRVPVVEDDRLVGIVTERDLLHWVDAAAPE